MPLYRPRSPVARLMYKPSQARGDTSSRHSAARPLWHTITTTLRPPQATPSPCVTWTLELLCHPSPFPRTEPGTRVCPCAYRTSRTSRTSSRSRRTKQGLRRAEEGSRCFSKTTADHPPSSGLGTWRLLPNPLGLLLAGLKSECAPAAPLGDRQELYSYLPGGLIPPANSTTYCIISPVDVACDQGVGRHRTEANRLDRPERADQHHIDTDYLHLSNGDVINASTAVSCGGRPLTRHPSRAGEPQFLDIFDRAVRGPSGLAVEIDRSPIPTHARS